MLAATEPVILSSQSRARAIPRPGAVSDRNPRERINDIMAQWIIVWCETDKSYSLLSDSDLICDVETLQVNDEVKFFYNKEEWSGTVRVIGG